MDFGNGTDLQTTIAHFLDVLRKSGGKAAFAKVRPQPACCLCPTHLLTESFARPQIKAVIPTYECL